MPVSDAELRAGLEVALGRPVGSIARTPWAYSSSAAIEELSVPGCPPLLFKDLTARSRSAPSFVLDPWREVEVYRRQLVGPDAPTCAGAVAGDHRAWLFLERLDAIPLWQAAGDEPWLAAARWLARLHSAPAPAEPGRLLIRDRAHLEHWVLRATATDTSGALGEIDTAAREAIEALTRWPVTLLHGEFYPSNVLVQESAANPPRIRPIDWEMAGIGPGLLDLAALIAGKHEPGLRQRIVDAYRAELTDVPETFAEALRAARLMVALQWIGWEPDWTPPDEHAHDWHRDALAFNGRRRP
jgi:Phosphotransferase enzyme family